MAAATKSAATITDKDIEKGNFWELGQYRHTVDRIYHGYKQCEDLLAFIKDRATIEENYSKHLREWTVKQQKVIESGTAYHTLKEAWLNSLKEADQLALVHMKIRDNIMSEPYEKLKLWKTENYHGLLLGLKESKMFSQEFYEAQKPWLKQCKKLDHVKKSYFHICKEEHAALTQVKRSEFFPQERKSKLHVIATKKTSEKNKKRDIYEHVMDALERVKYEYIDNMERISSKCQHLEELRLKFFKKILLEIHSQLDLSTNKNLPLIYHDVKNMILRASPATDIDWWRNNHGPGMPFYTPTFQEFDPKHPTILEEKLAVSPIDKVALNISPSMPSSSKPPKPSPPTIDPWHAADRVHNFSGASHQVEEPSQDLIDPSFFDDFPVGKTESWQVVDHDDDDTIYNSEIVLVQAVFSYHGQESDELTFSKGELLYRIENEDSQGWCKGKLKESGRIGLYPANYVEVVQEDKKETTQSFSAELVDIFSNFDK